MNCKSFDTFAEVDYKSVYERSGLSSHPIVDSIKLESTMSFSVTSATATTAAGAGLAVAGFGTSGITTGSIAAARQASIGDVAVGSVFATLQSFGAMGGPILMFLGGLA